VFIDELAPIFKALTQQPIAFLGGFVSGALRLNLGEDPVKSWLDRQAGAPSQPATNEFHNGKSRGPQAIAIE